MESEELSALTDEFAKPGITFSAGKGGLPLVRLERSTEASSAGDNFSADSAEVYLHGATATSWRTAGSEGRNGSGRGIGSSSAVKERLFLSDRAVYSPGKAIRGGIPVVFPQFGPGTLPSHGFARNIPWAVTSTEATPRECAVTLELRSDESSRALWPYSFSCQLRIRVSDHLALELRVTNMDSLPFEFQWAFHSYFSVSDIAQVNVRGVENLTYLDNLDAKRPRVESRSRATFAEEVDRIYCDAPDRLDLFEGEQQVLVIEKENFPDAVLWNPWIEKSKGMNDLAPEAYRRFVCVECGAIAKGVSLAPGQSFLASMTLRAPR